MTKILKKSLACLLAFVLCFTAVASCLAVSAAAPAMSAGFVMYAQRPSSNDIAVGRVCVGETLRAQISLVDITAGDYIGITLDMPKGVNPDEISVAGWNWNTPAAYETVSQYYNPETSEFKMLIKVTSSGNYLMFIRYNVTEEMQKNQVFVLECKVEGANSSAVGDDNIYTYTETRPIEIFDHDVVEDAGKDATCEEAGLTAGSHCARCEKVLEAQEEIEALGHAYDEGVANPDATCDSDGVKVYTCANDPSHTYTEAISAKGHNFVDGKCDVCGAADPDAEVPCEHDGMTFARVEKFATAEEEGRIIFNCPTCGEVGFDVQYSTKSNLTSTPALQCSSTTLLTVKYNQGSNGTPDMGIMVYNHKHGDGVTADKVDKFVVTAATEAEYKAGNYYEFPVPVNYNHFTDIFECTFFTLRDGVWYNGGTRNNSVKISAMKFVTGNTDEATKYAAANLLKAGAAVQQDFPYATDNLADAELIGDYAKYVVTEVKPFSKEVGTNFYSLPSDYKTAGKATFATPAIILAESVSIQLKVNPTYYSGGQAGLDNLRIEYTYVTENGDTVPGELTEYEWVSSRAVFTIGVNAPDMRSVITFKLYNGDQIVAEDAIYSIEGVLAHYYDKGNYTNSIERIMIYSDTVAKYF